MPYIYYQARGYTNQYSHINSIGIQNIRCRKLDLYRAMITVGNPSFISKQKIRNFGLARAIYSSIIEKVGVIWENIESDRNGMRLHPIYHTYVSDKKRIVSYNLGMAFAKFYAEKLLNIPNLIHVENLKNLNAINFHQTTGRGREPDLVGQCTNGNWHVFEAKGMSKNNLNTQVLSAKQQVQRVASIEGAVPDTLNACATYFNNRRILTYLEDPKSKDKKIIHINREKFLENFYKPIFLISEAVDKQLKLRKEDGLNYYSIDLDAKGLNLRIGLDEEIHDLIMQKEFNTISSISKQKFKRHSDDTIRENYSIGLDGIVVKYMDY